jgi:hypothetical protein
MKRFQCANCGQCVYFDNDRCLGCGSRLAYWPEEDRMLALAPGEGDEPFAASLGADETRQWRLCANRVHRDAGPDEPVSCNWVVGEQAIRSSVTVQGGASVAAPPQEAPRLCACCALTRVIPNLQAEANRERWRRIEAAKRRLVRTLLLAGLPIEPKRTDDDTDGLCFQWLEDVPDEPPVMTGHAQGTITLNIAEADDVERERRRVALQEPQRTLLGHLRHEVAHYLFHRFVRSPKVQALVRAAFGDERVDYMSALQRHYEVGAPADWAQHFISAYASSHPAEDWAETCAHVLLIRDAVETAAAWGVRLEGPRPVAPETPLELSGAANMVAARAPMTALHREAVLGAQRRMRQLAVGQWLPLAQYLNEMNRSLGLPDSYPFVLSDTVLRKMSTVQAVLMAAVAVP